MDPIPYLHEFVGCLLDEPAIAGDATWDTLALIGTVEDGVRSMEAWRFSEQKATPTPLRLPELSSALKVLHEHSSASDGRGWDMCILRLDRDTARTSTKFLVGDETEPWHISPDNLEAIVEALRPKESDFDSEGTAV